ncbi:MAG: SEL1-like repeat protein [Pseudomonadota bacterium]
MPRAVRNRLSAPAALVALCVAFAGLAATGAGAQDGPALRGRTGVISPIRAAGEIGEPAPQGEKEKAAYVAAVADYHRGRYAQARAALERLAGKGGADARYLLGHLHQQGLGAPKNLAEAIEHFVIAANDGQVDAQFSIGALARTGYKLGDTIYEPEPALARGWLELAAAKGHSLAQYELATMMAQGEGGKRDYEAAADLWESAANGGVVAAQTELGGAFVTGRGRTQDFAKAALWFSQAAEADDPDAMYNLALLYDSGMGVEQNPDEAARWLETAAAAGLPEAQTSLGLLAYQGRGVARSLTRAADLISQGAKNGDGEGQYLYAVLLAKGEGLDRDYEEAFRWASRSLSPRHDMTPESRAERVQLKDALAQKLTPQQRIAAEAWAAVRN